MTLIGPGSEWFWTAVSGLVLAGTFIAIYRQLALQRASAAIEQVAAIARDWLSEEMSRNRLTILLALRNGTDPTHLPPWATRYIGNFWERTGFLVRSGHMDARVVHETFVDIGLWWRWLAPMTYALRRETSDPELGQHFEWLAGRMDQMAVARGVRLPDEEAMLAARTRAIAQNLEAVRTAEALRSVPSPGPSPLVARADRDESATGPAPAPAMDPDAALDDSAAGDNQ